MSWNLANEKWIEFTARGAGGDDESGVGDESGLLGQFASGRGLSDLVKLVKASSGYPALSDFLLHGVTDHVAEVREELGRLAEHAPADVAFDREGAVGVGRRAGTDHHHERRKLKAPTALYW
jgi:hypothetical protein